MTNKILLGGEVGGERQMRKREKDDQERGEKEGGREGEEEGGSRNREG